MKQEQVRRLAFIRYLYRLSVQQSQLPGPIAATSILTFHDSVELFLQLAIEFLNISTKAKMDFLDYWELIGKSLPGGELGMKESMSRLNRARVGLKHAGIIPDKSEIEGFKSSVTRFFEETAPKIFDGKKFDEVSMVDLVQYERTRLDLQKAEELVKSRLFKDALSKAALAFAKLIDDYEDQRRKRFGRSPFFFGDSFAFQRPDRLGFEGSNLDQFLENVGRTLGDLQGAMKILSLGLDYRLYSKFRAYTPVIIAIPEGEYIVQSFEESEATSEIDNPALEERCRFSVDFVIESAFRLQEAG